MSLWRHVLLYLVTLPWDVLVAWPVVMLVNLFWGDGLSWEKPPAYRRAQGGGGVRCLSCQSRPGTFPVTPGRFPRGWYYNKKYKRAWGGTALGHGVFYGPYGRGEPSEWTRTQAHEHVHVEQCEVAMFQSLVVGVVAGVVLWTVGHPWWGLGVFLGIWTTGYLMMAVAGWLVALLRGEEAYWGSTHEESARAQTER
jgi:hypothetical protein